MNIKKNKLINFKKNFNYPNLVKMIIISFLIVILVILLRKNIFLEKLKKTMIVMLIQLL